MNAFAVAKFGGTSVADHAAMSHCASVIEENKTTRLVIVSACSGVTNLLVELSNGVDCPLMQQTIISKIAEIHFDILARLPDAPDVKNQIHAILDQIKTLSISVLDVPSSKITDSLVACGELMSSHIFTHLLNAQAIKARFFDVRQVLKTDANYGKATPNLELISQYAQELLIPLCKEQVVVTQGFMGSDSLGNTTTLGRGGSDYSAALLAEAIQADILEIWTDVPGIYSTDPRIASQAKPISEISFNEASEMANFGAKILHPATLLPAMRRNIPVFVGSSQAPKLGGTWIRHQAQASPLFRALALRCNQTLITLTSLNMLHAYGFLANVFNILAEHKISVDLITTSEVSVSLTLDQTNTCGGAPMLPKEVEKALEKLCRVTVEQDICLVALIGNKMGESRGGAAKIFGALKDYNLRMICYGASNHNLCFLTHTNEAKDVVRALHKELFE